MVLGNGPLEGQWTHDSWPKMLQKSDIVTNRDFPDLRLFYHPKIGLWCVERANMGEEILPEDWPRDLTVATGKDSTRHRGRWPPKNLTTRMRATGRPGQLS